MNIRIQLAATVLMLTGLATSCVMKDDFADCPPKKPLQVVSSIDFGGGTTLWPKGSEIGITVLKAGTNQSWGNDSDKHYKITDPVSGESVPDDDADPIYLPDDGSESDIIAYYPYSTPFDNTYKAALSVFDQSEPDSLDLITSDRVCNIPSDAERIDLQFYRRLTKLSFNIKLIEVHADGSETTIDERLPGTSLAVTGMPVTGVYSLTDNILTTSNDVRDITTLINKEGTHSSAIVFPRPAGEGVTFVVTLPDGSEHIRLMSPEQVLAAATENKFNIVIKLKKDAPAEPEYKITYELQGSLTPDNIAVKQGTANAAWGLNQTIIVKKGGSFSFLYDSKLSVNARLKDGTVLHTQNNTSYPFTGINKDIHIILSASGDPEPPIDPEPPVDPTDPAYKITYELKGDLTIGNITVRQGSSNAPWSSSQTITVKKGENFSFSYNSDLTVRVVLSDGTVVNMSNNVSHTFSNISKDIHIILSANASPTDPDPGPTPPNPVYYKVTYELKDLSAADLTVTAGNAPNVTLWEETKIVTVQRGSSFTFTYTNINKQVKSVFINDKGITTTASGTPCTITNINSNQHIILGGEINHIVTLMINVPDQIFKSLTSVYQNGSYKFKIPTLKPGEEILVKIDGVETTVNPDAEGYYTISNITTDRTILITVKKDATDNPNAIIKADVHKWDNFKTENGGVILPNN